MKTISWFLFCTILLTLLVQSCFGQIYVSTRGDDIKDGSFDHPYTGIKEARDAVRAMENHNTGNPLIIYIKDGEYELDSPLLFDEQDSGTKSTPVIYRALNENEPVITGGKRVMSWKRLEDEKILKRIPAGVRPFIYVADLKQNGIDNWGDPIAANNRPELVCNGELQTLSRWPNSGFIKAGQVRGSSELPPTYLKKHGTVEGVFEYLDEYQDRWAEENDVRLQGYWYWDWKDEHQSVDSINIVSNTIFIKTPFHHYGYGDSLRYYGLNLLCEIDKPGEWYIDRSDGLIYWYPPKGIDPNSSNVTLTNFNAPFMIDISNCNYLSIEGLTFRDGRGSAVRINGGENCHVVDCRIERFGNDGIHINGGRDHGVEGCYLHDLGCSGINILGGDRRTLTSSGHVVKNTIVEHFSLFNRTYEPAIYAEGCGHYIGNNRFRFSSSSAMRLEGNDFIVEYNQVSHVVSESDDQGGIDMWYNPSYQGVVIRYNHWSDISGRSGHNGAAGVRLDDMISGVQVYGNLFERCGSVIFGAIQIHGGKENIVKNNVFYQCYAAVSFSAWNPKRWFEQLDSDVINTKLYKDVDINSQLYQEKYPVLRDLRSNPNQNTVKKNLIVDCENQFLRNKKEYNLISNNTVLPSGGKTLEQLCGPDIMSVYGMEPIQFKKIGPQQNKWIR